MPGKEMIPYGAAFDLNKEPADTNHLVLALVIEIEAVPIAPLPLAFVLGNG